MRKLIKYLPRWIRQGIALFLELRAGEYGGIIYDYSGPNNGDLNEIHRWEDDGGMNQAWSILENAINGGRDFVYVGIVKTGQSRGYFVVHSPIRKMWIKAFRPGIYEPLDAFRDAMWRAHYDAKKLGFSVPPPYPEGV